MPGFGVQDTGARCLPRPLHAVQGHQLSVQPVLPRTQPQPHHCWGSPRWSQQGQSLRDGSECVCLPALIWEASCEAGSGSILMPLLPPPGRLQRLPQPVLLLESLACTGQTLAANQGLSMVVCQVAFFWETVEHGGQTMGPKF